MDFKRVWGFFWPTIIIGVMWAFSTLALLFALGEGNLVVLLVGLVVVQGIAVWSYMYVFDPALWLFRAYPGMTFDEALQEATIRSERYQFTSMYDVDDD